jgi:hypothetical protein
VLRLLWSGDAAGVSFQGEFFSLSAAAASPSRMRGASCLFMSADRAWPRAGRRGDGLLPWWQADIGAACRADHRDAGRSSRGGHDPAALEYTR